MGKRDVEKHQVKTAILVDGGFYRKRARSLWGDVTPREHEIDHIINDDFRKKDSADRIEGKAARLEPGR